MSAPLILGGMATGKVIHRKVHHTSLHRCRDFGEGQIASDVGVNLPTRVGKGGSCHPGVSRTVRITVRQCDESINAD
ncbi:MAG: hypothetical protein AAF411_18400, partial [Myxococcota bacterium]